MIRAIKSLSDAWKLLLAIATAIGLLATVIYAIVDTRYTSQMQTQAMVKEFTTCMEKLKEKDVEQDKVVAAQEKKLDVLATKIQGTLDAIRVELRYQRRNRE